MSLSINDNSDSSPPPISKQATPLAKLISLVQSVSLPRLPKLPSSLPFTHHVASPSPATSPRGVSEEELEIRHLKKDIQNLKQTFKKLSLCGMSYRTYKTFTGGSPENPSLTLEALFTQANSSTDVTFLRDTSSTLQHLTRTIEDYNRSHESFLSSKLASAYKKKLSSCRTFFDIRRVVGDFTVQLMPS